MNINYQYEEGVLYFLFWSAKNAILAANKINNAHYKAIISIRTAERCIKKFKRE